MQFSMQQLILNTHTCTVHSISLLWGFNEREYLNLLRQHIEVWKYNVYSHLYQQTRQINVFSEACYLQIFNDAFIFQILFGNKLFYPHNFLEKFLGAEVCSREMLNVVCRNALFAMTGFDKKNLNMVCMHWNFYSEYFEQPSWLLVSSSIRNGTLLEPGVTSEFCPWYADKPARNHKSLLAVLLPPHFFHHLTVPWSKQLVGKTKQNKKLPTHFWSPE